MYSLTHLATAVTAAQPHFATGLLGLAGTIAVLGLIALMLKHTLHSSWKGQFKWLPIIQVVIACSLIVWILADPVARLGMFGDAIGGIVVDLLGLVKDTFTGGVTATP